MSVSGVKKQEGVFFNRPVFSVLLKLILLLFVIPLTAESQILNIERLRLERDTTRPYLVKATAGLNIYNRSAAADDPVNLFGYNLNVNGIYTPGAHSYVMMSAFDYLRINENDFLNFGFIHGRVNFFKKNELSYEVFAQYSFDNFRGLDPRLLGGAGVRYRFVRGAFITAIFGTGLLYEHETWRHPVTDTYVDVDFLKSSSYLSFRATINDMVDLNVVGYYQAGYDQMISRLRNRLSASVILNTRLTQRFSLTNSFDVSYEDRPIVPITSVIYAFKTGLSVDL